jgi:hypothetical protein
LKAKCKARGWRGSSLTACGKLYRLLPMEGTWDWLLLFLLLAAVTQLSFMPYLWRCVESDMKMLRDRKGGKESVPDQGGVARPALGRRLDVLLHLVLSDD